MNRRHGSLGRIFLSCPLLHEQDRLYLLSRWATRVVCHVLLMTWRDVLGVMCSACCRFQPSKLPDEPAQSAHKVLTKCEL